MVDAALSYMAMGWAVFPVEGKVPTTSHGCKDASTEERMAGIWWERHPYRGIALATGEPSGVWVLDLDGEEGKEAFVEMQAKYGRIPQTVASRTGSGYHLFFTMPADCDIRNSASQVAPKVDVRGTGGYVVIPPSPHPNGRNYEWLKDRGPENTDIMEAPEWLIALVTSPKVEAPSGERVTIPDEIPEGGGIFGGRDEALFRIGCSLRAKGLSEDAIAAALLVENRDRCIPPLDEATVRRKAAQAARYDPGVIQAPKPNGNGNGPHPRDPETGQRREAPRIDVVDMETLRQIAINKQKPVDAVNVPWSKWRMACRGAGGGRGLARGWHIVVGASSGAGKSLCAANIVAASIQDGHDTCLISLEMSKEENVTRLLAIASGIPVRDLEHGDFRPDQWEAASEILMERSGRFATNPGKVGTLDEIVAIVRRQAEDGFRLIIVDYLQLAWVKGADSLYHQITEVSHAIQGLAKELNITTVGLSQVNRRTSSGDSSLAKEGLMGGSSLENDAEQVVLIGKGEQMIDGKKSVVKLDKNRHGPQVEWNIHLDTTTLQMRQTL